MILHDEQKLPFNLKEIAKPLLAWYDKGRRILPWREDPSPYHVWISEIMLQQTRVEAVKPYYDRFMRELPDIRSLADVEEEKLLKLWEGLGYYNRARNLKKAAEKIVMEYDGQMPGSYEELVSLPGIGSYTAGAVSSIAFGRAHPAVDGNVLHRRKFIHSRKQSLIVPFTDCDSVFVPDDQYRLLLDVPRLFLCLLGKLHDPVFFSCKAEPAKRTKITFCRSIRNADYRAKFHQRLVEIPRPVLWHEDRVAIRKRDDKGLLAGMYEFPSMEGSQSAGRVIAYLKAMGVSPLKIEELPPSKHIFTHKEWHMTGFYIRIDELERMEPEEELLY